MSVLAEEPLHGYLIAQRLKKLAFFQDALPDYGGIYRTLNGMEEQRLVKAKWDTGEAGPAKRRYELTAQGRSCMARWLQTLKGYRRAVDELTASLEEGLSKKTGAR